MPMPKIWWRITTNSLLMPITSLPIDCQRISTRKVDNINKIPKEKNDSNGSRFSNLLSLKAINRGLNTIGAKINNPMPIPNKPKMTLLHSVLYGRTIFRVSVFLKTEYFSDMFFVLLLYCFGAKRANGLR